MTDTIRFRLNGEEAESHSDPSARLLDVLREEFLLTGVKCGCKEGECGACSVIIDGQLANSCMVALGSVSGSDVMTIEGYSKTKRYQKLSEAYAEFSAVQCGFCIPGMVMASEALLSHNPHPTEEEIREGISGNLCRCTGYSAIVSAIKKASENGEGLW
jgi:carbon-monoxide dehydrogenase small subunit